ncbi:MAG: AbrB/MazE/SpoVT family DNA-binding domain-containing protein [Candidatus Solibacter usitatus]|nr:AbrB/MazE/SpoVT family DNA-binding domain-containing protein [Candidatus Solibacter usitatus]
MLWMQENQMSSKPMTITLTSEFQRMLPPQVRRKSGFKPGDQVEVKASGGVVTLVPKLPTANDGYTAEQRRVLDAQLDEAEKGPLHGPFKNGKEIAAYLKIFKAQRSGKSIKPKHSR